MSEGKALPCPFCGSSEAKIGYVRDGRRVHCKCGAAGPCEFHGPADMPSADERAIEAWNRRASPIQGAAT
jgi:Lar family restriction alleviation protein